MTLVAVDELRDAQIAGERAEHIGLVAGDRLVRSQIASPFRAPPAWRRRRVLVETDRHQVCGAFGERPRSSCPCVR